MKALFLDRDGVINEDLGYVYRKENFRFLDGVFDFCRLMQKRGFSIIVITNQSGIARGYFTEADYAAITQYMVSRFAVEGISILDVFHCPTLDGNDRKPLPGMFLKAAERYGIAMVDSVNVGDNERDLAAGRAAGVGTNLLFTGDWNAIKGLIA